LVKEGFASYTLESFAASGGYIYWNGNDTYGNKNVSDAVAQYAYLGGDANVGDDVFIDNETTSYSFPDQNTTFVVITTNESGNCSIEIEYLTDPNNLGNVTLLCTIGSCTGEFNQNLSHWLINITIDNQTVLIDNPVPYANYTAWGIENITFPLNANGSLETIYFNYLTNSSNSSVVYIVIYVINGSQNEYPGGGSGGGIAGGSSTTIIHEYANETARVISEQETKLKNLFDKMLDFPKEMTYGISNALWIALLMLIMAVASWYKKKRVLALVFILAFFLDVAVYSKYLFGGG
jgi:hypothetical protein